MREVKQNSDIDNPDFLFPNNFSGKSLFVSATYKCNYYYSMNNKSSKCEIRESAASLSLAERWTITEIRRRFNSVLTYFLLTDVLLMKKVFFKVLLEHASVN